MHGLYSPFAACLARLNANSLRPQLRAGEGCLRCGDQLGVGLLLLLWAWGSSAGVLQLRWTLLLDSAAVFVETAEVRSEIESRTGYRYTDMDHAEKPSGTDYATDGELRALGILAAETVSSPAADRERQMEQYVDRMEANGIRQHSDLWLERRMVGGSDISSLTGDNPFASEAQFLRRKIGLESNSVGVAANWGTMFEPVCCEWVENEFDCEIIGCNMFVMEEGSPITYSPDGLAFMDLGQLSEATSAATDISTPNRATVDAEGLVIEDISPAVESELVTVPDERVVLCEFKCPYSRAPSSRPPAYYIPQVQTGLSVIPVAEVGLLAEAVFRRCAMGDAGPTPDHDSKANPVYKRRTWNPLAIGCIGVHINKEVLESGLYCRGGVTAARFAQFVALYKSEFGRFGCAVNDYANNCLGSTSKGLFVELMHFIDNGFLSLHYFPTVQCGRLVCAEQHRAGPIDRSEPVQVTPAGPFRLVQVPGGAPVREQVTDARGAVVLNFAEHQQYCRNNGYTNVGVLPWKLFNIFYHRIEKDPHFLDELMPRIERAAEAIRRGKLADSDSDKWAVINEYNAAGSGAGCAFFEEDFEEILVPEGF